MPATHSITIARDPKRKGCSDEWTAVIDEEIPPGGKRKHRVGIGRNSTEAMGTLVGTNLELFGISRIANVDPGAMSGDVVVWERTESEPKPA